MDEINTISQFNARIVRIYSDQELTSLRGIAPNPDDHWVFEGVDLHTKYYTVTQEEKDFYRMDIFDELVELSDQILYFTAHTFLYAQHINNPLHHAVHPPGYDEEFFLNYQNMPAKRFNFYIDTVAEKFYAYWTRLAHLLNHYLPQPIPTKAVNFSIVIDQLERQLPQHHQNPGYIWLKNFKENEQKDLNRERSTIVHHLSTATAFAKAYRQADRHALSILMEERLGRPEFFKQHMLLSLRALSKALDLIAVVAPVPLVVTP